MKFPVSLYFFLLLTATFSNAQVSQTIRGEIRDQLSKEPLTGTTVILADSTMTQGVICDIDGKFRLDNVPLGRQTLIIKMLGYRDQVIPVVVTSGKEVVLNIELEQMVLEGKEVVITADKEKDKANNEMTTVSARSFTYEETSRYAGSLGDPSRMAMNYAGVSGANDARNDIIIRGNSPLGLLWRLNDIDIPNPNHFGALGVTGGPVSILNNNTLDKSDFLTGAFPAEFGNAIAGSFDLKMRSGNNEKKEFIAQIGFNGFELGAEGPFNKNRSTFLINYRYSTLGVFHALGIDFGTGSTVPEYQDITFRFDHHAGKAGRFSLFGIGGISYAEVLDADRDTTSENIYIDDMRQNGRFGNTIGVAGLSHVYFINSNSYIKTSLAASTAGQEYEIDSIAVNENLRPLPWYRNHSNQQKYSASIALSKKFSSKNFIKTGVTGELIDYHYTDSLLEDNAFRTYSNTTGRSALFRAFAQWQHKFSDRLTFNSGLHYIYFNLNGTNAIEPRAGLKWEMREGQSISLGTGLHSQIQPMYIYFQESNVNGIPVNTNKNLDLTSSIHYVLAFDKSFSRSMRFKTEVYYQDIYNVPVEIRPTWFSLLNEGADFGISAVDSLVNKGTGENYGFEITLERFYDKGWYFLATGSIFESKYRGSDGVTRNTAFNGNYSATVLAGKEWTVKKKNVIGINIRQVISGGKRYIPIDFASSQISGETEYFTDLAFSERHPDYMRSDIKITYRVNKKKSTHEFSLDIDNLFNRKNIWQQQYDPVSNTVKTEYQLGIFPVPMYRVTF